MAAGATAGLQGVEIVLPHDDDRYGAPGLWRTTAAAPPTTIEIAEGAGLAFVRVPSPAVVQAPLRSGRHAGAILASITSTLTGWIGHHGAYAVFAVMAVDALFPVGGELTMLFAGALAAGAIAGRHPVLFGHELSTGLQSYLVLALAGTLGYLVGALVGWAVGRRGGRPLLDRHGRWLGVAPGDLDRAEAWFARHGRSAVFLGRLTPLVRSFVSIPAGVLESPLRAYTLLTLAGSAIWCFAFAGAGWALGSSYERVHHVFGYVDVLVVAGLVLAAAALAFLHRRRARVRGAGPASPGARPQRGS